MTKRLEIKRLNKNVVLEHDKCITFLKDNGWESDFDSFKQDPDYMQFNKNDSYSVHFEVLGDDMIFIDDTGDFLHMPVNLYTLIGVLIYHRMLTVCFKQ